MPAADPADPRPIEVLAVLRFGRWPLVLWTVFAAVTAYGWMSGDVWWGSAAMAVAIVVGSFLGMRSHRLVEVTTWDLRFVHIWSSKTATIPWRAIDAVSVTSRTVVVRTDYGASRRVPLWLGDAKRTEVLAILRAEAEAHGVRVETSGSAAERPS